MLVSLLSRKFLINNCIIFIIIIIVIIIIIMYLDSN